MFNDIVVDEITRGGMYDDSSSEEHVDEFLEDDNDLGMMALFLVEMDESNKRKHACNQPGCVRIGRNGLEASYP